MKVSIPFIFAMSCITQGLILYKLRYICSLIRVVLSTTPRAILTPSVTQTQYYQRFYFFSCTKLS